LIIPGILMSAANPQNLPFPILGIQFLGVIELRPYCFFAGISVVQGRNLIPPSGKNSSFNNPPCNYVLLTFGKATSGEAGGVLV
jgi:hypothetical protein